MEPQMTRDLRQTMASPRQSDESRDYSSSNFFALVAALILSACGNRPTPDVEPTRRIAWKAVRLVRPSAPLKAKYIERLVADAEVALGKGQARLWIRRITGDRELRAAGLLPAKEVAHRFHGLELVVKIGLEV